MTQTPTNLRWESWNTVFEELVTENGERAESRLMRVTASQIEFHEHELEEQTTAYRKRLGKPIQGVEWDLFDKWFIEEYLIERDDPFTSDNGFMEGI